MHRLLLLLLNLLLATAVHAQLRPSRTWESDVTRMHTTQGVMPSLQGGAEIQRTMGSYGGEQAWQFRTHVQAEPFRFTDSTDAVQITTTIEAHQELTANPHNDITFNPRAMRWEEYLWLQIGLPDVSLRAGFVHRCKHDIDNLGGADEFNPVNPLDAEQRTVILTGPALAASIAPITTVVGTLRASGGVEYFINASDTRTPASIGGSWSGMQGAAWLRASATYPLSSLLALQLDAFGSMPWFTSHRTRRTTLPFDARADLALVLTGRAATIHLALTAERLFDEITIARPHATQFVGVALKFMPR